ncbi:MAG TPA: hypothetical protein VMA77_16895 [Solirubrobacteraceae bacterium]|nr:hypothetical protein [Solirubrobacteraceae bacterium]
MAEASSTAVPEAQADGLIAHCEREFIDRVEDFKDPRQEWRRQTPSYTNDPAARRPHERNVQGGLS